MPSSPAKVEGQLLAIAVEYPGPFRQPFQHQVQGFRVIERGIRPLPRGELEVQRCPAILLDGDAVAVAILGPVGGIEIEMGFIHYPHQIHVQALAAGLLLVHHGVGLAAGIGQDGGVLHHPLDGEIEIDVAVFGRQQLEVIDAVIGHLVVAVGIQSDRHPAQQQVAPAGRPLMRTNSCSEPSVVSPRWASPILLPRSIRVSSLPWISRTVSLASSASGFTLTITSSGSPRAVSLPVTTAMLFT